jgi:hypothetical protein
MLVANFGTFDTPVFELAVGMFMRGAALRGAR